MDVEVEIPAVPAVKDLTAADALYGAAEMLSKPNGWMKGAATNHTGAYCAAGAKK